MGKKNKRQSVKQAEGNDSKGYTEEFSKKKNTGRGVRVREQKQRKEPPLRGAPTEIKEKRRSSKKLSGRELKKKNRKGKGSKFRRKAKRGQHFQKLRRCIHKFFLWWPMNPDRWYVEFCS